MNTAGRKSSFVVNKSDQVVDLFQCFLETAVIVCLF